VFGQALIEGIAALVHDANALQAKPMSLAGLESGRLDGFAGPKAAHDLVILAVARLINERPKLRVPVNDVAPDNTGTDHAFRPA
jgi:hypothetical protein